MDTTPREQAMMNDTDVVGHIERAAAAIKVAAEASGDTFYMLPTTIWAERGDFANVYEYERSMALGEFSDIHKETYGFRPRGDYSSMTLTDIDAEIHEMLSPNTCWGL